MSNTMKDLYDGGAKALATKTFERKTTMGIPVRIVIETNTIRAYRVEPAQVLTHEFKDGEMKTSVEPELSRYFTEEPVMEIRKHGCDDYTVDFDAGFQRGRITVGQKELTTRCTWPQSGPGYLKWIGLSYADPEVRAWLKDGEA